MSLHLGHLLGLRLIKQAVSPDVTEYEQYVHEPLSEGSDKGDRAVSEAFDGVEEHDQMIDESTKTSAEAAFATGNGYDEDKSSDEKDKSRDRDVDENAINVDRAWREHEGFSSSEGPHLAEIANPGPAV